MRDQLELAEIFDGATQPELALLSDAWQWVLAELPLERLETLPAGIVHGDFHGRNLLFEDDDIYRDWMARIPLRRHAEPREMAGTVLYLVSDASSYTNGECIVVDGGLTI